jgi:hypothetical protein
MNKIRGQKKSKVPHMTKKKKKGRKQEKEKEKK